MSQKLIDYGILIGELLNSDLAEIEKTAGEIGAVNQSTEAERLAWIDGVAICVEPILHKLVLECAKVCDVRAQNRCDNIPIYNEASKCGHAIRHVLICNGDESICLYCDGEGCDRCSGSGVVHMKRITPHAGDRDE